MRKKLLKIMPAYSWKMTALLLGANYAAYFGTRVLTAGRKHYSMACLLDRKIPLVPFFVLFYLLAYVQWIVGFVMIGRDSRETVFRVFSGELMAKGIAMACFLLLPTTMAPLRPGAGTLQSGDIWCRLTALVYRLDAPDNLFPSIHCLESWVCFRGALKLKRAPVWYPRAMLAVTLLVFASTVLVRQHVLADIAGGVAAAEIGMAMAGRLPYRGGKE